MEAKDQESESSSNCNQYANQFLPDDQQNQASKFSAFLQFRDQSLEQLNQKMTEKWEFNFKETKPLQLDDPRLKWIASQSSEMVIQQQEEQNQKLVQQELIQSMEIDQQINIEFISKAAEEEKESESK